MAFENPVAMGHKVGEALRTHSTALVLGGLIGLISGGFTGMLLGAGVCFAIARGIRMAVKKYNPQEAFFRATFTVMGKLAKADGRVTESEIAFARQVMAQMNLSEERRKMAIDFFTEGKQDDFDMGQVLRPLQALFRYQPPLKFAFIELQLQATMADGEISQPEAAAIAELCAHLSLSQIEMEALIARLQAQQDFHRHSGDGMGGMGGFNQAQLLQDAYGVLGVEEEASDAEVKKAYRRLMSQHHPDKLVAKGLPPEMMEMAKEKAQEIQAAYDRIRQARKAASS
ncbi:MAG: co-chaperone DjlA [Marinobacterium sp.]|nr:co-chaperone DjlA [Marinobacterium sp.]